MRVAGERFWTVASAVQGPSGGSPDGGGGRRPGDWSRFKCAMWIAVTTSQARA
jgi:hypothetical protein